MSNSFDVASMEASSKWFKRKKSTKALQLLEQFLLISNEYLSFGPKTFNLSNENFKIVRKVDGTVCEYNFNQYLRWGMKMVIKKEKWNEIDIKYFVAT